MFSKKRDFKTFNSHFRHTQNSISHTEIIRVDNREINEKKYLTAKIIYDSKYNYKHVQHEYNKMYHADQFEKIRINII